MGKRISGLALHVHHDILWEYCFDYNERVEYIKQNKPLNEQPLRLKLLQIIPEDRLPGRESPEWSAYDKAKSAYDKAWSAFVKAKSAYDKAWSAYDKARSAFVKAKSAYDKAWSAYLSKYSRELEELHKELCPDCPWDGKTIFLDKG